jgi:hypothetical protein
VKARYISQHTKVKMYTAMVKPAVLYGCESWAATEKMKSSLKTWERKIVSKIYGPITDRNAWRTQSNDELQVTYTEPME